MLVETDEQAVPRPEATVRATRAVARLARQVERALDGAGLSLPQYRLLALLADSPELASSLAGLLAVRPPSVTALVNGLVRLGLVERQVADHDRRCVSHRLTDDGRAALTTADHAVAERLTTLTGHLDDDGAGAALDGLERWADALDAARRLAADAHPHAHAGAGATPAVITRGVACAPR
ncbi:hypothetical protein BH24ACT2_BH24ACT2_08110 [soil metagenome]